VVAIVCALATAVGFYFSIGLGEQWWLAWLAPLPVVWLAFRRETPWWAAFLAAWAGYSLGATSMLRAYLGVLPDFVLISGLVFPGFFFAVAVSAGRLTAHRIAPLVGALTFAALWAGFDFLGSFNAGGGAVATPATAEVFAPALMQVASLVGIWGITFLLGFVPAGIAASITSRSPMPAIVAVAVFAANAVFGFARMSAPEETLRVALINTDVMQKAAESNNEKDTRDTVDAYVQQIAALKGKGIKLIVLPEKLAIVQTAWQPEAKAKLAGAAKDVGAVLVAGFDARDGAKAYNVSWAYTPQGTGPTIYTKRQLVPGLELRYTRGPGPLAMTDGMGLEICKDMDFQAMVRSDMVATKPRLLAVPAWDFVTDASNHAKSALLRTVENGVPMARTARNGLLTLNDKYGRVVAMKVTGGSEFDVLVGDLPLNGHGGETLYDKIGDAFGWLCLVIGLGFAGFSLVRRRAA
jgi:apolipoprotein N-acyltransferase